MSLAHKLQYLDNPIDLIENILKTKPYEIERRSSKEIVAEFQGKWNNLLIFFSWEQSMNCLHISCLINIENQLEQKHGNIYELLALINDDLWVGHFSYWNEQKMPVFRHSLFCNQQNSDFYSQVSQLIDIAVKECERMYPIFNVVLAKGMAPSQALFNNSTAISGQA